MAFKMNRPIIKGTPFHKASIAKATSESIVAQTRTQADSSLVGAANELGKSYIPAAIDYSVDTKAIEIPESKEDNGDREKPETEKQKQKRINKRRKQKIDDRRLGKKEGNQKIYDNLTKRKNSRGLTEQEQEALDKASKELGIKKIKENTKNTINTKKLSLSDRWKAKRSKKRLAKAEKDGGVSTDTDYSQIDNEPKTKRVKAESYKTPSASSAEAKENKERMDKSQEVSLNKAAKKHNVKPEDLEVKEINGKKEYFPKQGVQGGFDRNLIPVIDEQTGDPKLDQDGEVVMRIDPEDKGTKWDDKLGRFKKAKATTGTMEEQQKAVEEMKPKYPQGMDPNLKAKGEIALNYETNTYEYTNVYNSRIAREKIAAIEAKRNSEKEVTTNQAPVSGEQAVADKTLTPRQVREKRMADKKYNNPETSQYIKGQMIKEGYNPIQSKSPAQMRDDRVYRNAMKDGPVRKNMIKGGYKPL